MINGKYRCPFKWSYPYPRIGLRFLHPRVVLFNRSFETGATEDATLSRTLTYHSKMTDTHTVTKWHLETVITPIERIMLTASATARRGETRFTYSWSRPQKKKKRKTSSWYRFRWAILDLELRISDMMCVLRKVKINATWIDSLKQQI